MARRKQLGSSSEDHLEQAEHSLREAYKFAAQISSATRRNNCGDVWNNIMSTYGMTMQAQAQLDAIAPSFARTSNRVKQAANNAQGLFSRVLDARNSVGWQCLRDSNSAFSGAQRRKRRR